MMTTQEIHIISTHCAGGQWAVECSHCGPLGLSPDPDALAASHSC